jgi:hypothetical protein
MLDIGTSLGPVGLDEKDSMHVRESAQRQRSELMIYLKMQLIHLTLYERGCFCRIMPRGYDGGTLDELMMVREG